MAQSRKSNSELMEENIRLRAQVAQLEDRLDHLSEHGAAAKALQQSEALHRDVMSVVSDAVLIADEAGPADLRFAQRPFYLRPRAGRHPQARADRLRAARRLVRSRCAGAAGRDRQHRVPDSRCGRPGAKPARHRAPHRSHRAARCCTSAAT